MFYNTFKIFQNHLFKELTKVFYAGFILLHSWQKPKASANHFQLPQFIVGINLLQLSFVNLMAMTTNRYVMKLKIYEDFSLNH